MNTSITRSGNAQRLRLQSLPESKAAGTEDARQLLDSLNELFADPDGTRSSGLLIHALTETIALATENRAEECSARLEGFAEAIGPLLYRTAALEAKCALLAASLNQADRVAETRTDEQRAVDAAIATCSQLSAGRIIAAHQDDDDAIVTLCELQLAVRALEPKFTETEGGEL
jgi:hypothetical protein